MSTKSKYYFLLLIGLTLNCQAITTLSCSVKGYEENSLTRQKIDEQISVSIDEQDFLSIDVEGSDAVSFVMASEKIKGVNKVTNLSNNEKWYLRNEGVSPGGDRIDGNVSINRLTGIISYSGRFGPIFVTYSGLCKKITPKEIKF